MTDKIPCTKCNELILPATAKKTGGICMACAQGIRESMEKSREFLRKQKEYDPHRELWNYLIDKAEKKGFDSLTKEEKIYYSSNLCEGEIYNGGMHQFFSNSSGELYAEAIESFSELKAEKSLTLLKQAARILFDEIKPPKDRVKRWKAMKKFPEQENAPEMEWEIELTKIDEKFWEDPDNLGELLSNYAEKNGLIEPFIKNK